jgi:hypothetical protein
MTSVAHAEISHAVDERVSEQGEDEVEGWRKRARSCERSASAVTRRVASLTATFWSSQSTTTASSRSNPHAQDPHILFHLARTPRCVTRRGCLNITLDLAVLLVTSGSTLVCL